MNTVFTLRYKVDGTLADLYRARTQLQNAFPAPSNKEELIEVINQYIEHINTNEQRALLACGLFAISAGVTLISYSIGNHEIYSTSKVITMVFLAFTAFFILNEQRVIFNASQWLAHINEVGWEATQ